ncbi:hypothetical protein RF11_07462 [Thelohanellus kitauei]|uniref:Uncharacterized protein n=1 Tax=Thelohanellus kitauei TaxID=669202 RepID=A0A0C2MYL4_THEKT|nr:hypothetical protein RF11_08707 [Thelohanellus kitauei]KII73679.1 hypothetical protein RF11_07462 [Thelohanellus kitauei]
MSEYPVDYCVSYIRDAVPSKKQTPTSPPFPYPDTQIDSKTLVKLWIMEKGAIKAVPENVDAFRDQLAEYLKDKSDENIRASAMNVLCVIIFCGMTKQQRKDIKCYKRKPTDAIPQSLQIYELPLLKNMVELYGSPKMKEIEKALIQVADTYLKQYTIDMELDQKDSPSFMKLKWNLSNKSLNPR